MPPSEDVIYTYQSAADPPEYLEGIPARDLTQGDVDALNAEKTADLAAYIADANPSIYAEP